VDGGCDAHRTRVGSPRSRFRSRSSASAQRRINDGASTSSASSNGKTSYKNISLNVSYGFNNVTLPEGAFKTYLVGVRWNVSFTNSLLTSAYLQYNSAGELAAVQLRLNYIFRTIDNVYLVYNDTRFTAGPFADTHNRSLVLKVTYSVHR